MRTGFYNKVYWQTGLFLKVKNRVILP